MNLARILYPVQVLGPGNRIGLWLCGCTRSCKGCSNPELWEQRSEYEITPAQIFSLIQKIAKSYQIDGFTVTGGEPMDQTNDLAELLCMASNISDDILIYTGYSIEELKAKKDSATDFVLKSASVLIDGAYIEELNNNSVLRGSSNQHIHILNDNYYDLYNQYLNKTHNRIQNFTTTNGIVSVGIHHKGFSNS